MISDKKTLILLFFIILHCSLYAQNQAKIDSLKNLLKANTANKLEVYLNLSKELSMYHPEKSRVYAQKALKLSKKNTKAQGQCLKSIGLAYYFEQQTQKAKQYLQQALNTFRSIKDKEGESAVLHNIGLCYQKERDLEKALNYFMKSLHIEEETGNRAGLVASYANIAMVLEAQLEHQKALAYYLKALVIAKETENKPYQVQVYFNIARLYFEEKEYENAKKFADSTLYLSQKIEMPFGIAKAEEIRGEIFCMRKDYSKALASVEVSEKIFSQMQASNDLLNLALIKAKIYEQQENYEEMNAYAQKAARLNQEKPNFENSRRVYHLLYKSHKALGQEAKSLEYLEKLMQYKDSIFVKEKNASIRELITKYETKEKEEKIKNLSQANKIQTLELSQKNTVIVAGITFTLLSLLVFYLFYRQTQLQNQKKNLGLEQKLLRTQLNPHFIFNALNAIQDYILNMERAEASIYLAQFAQLMRQILENSREEYIPLEQEIETLENYLSLQQLRFEDKFDYEINLAEELDSEEIYIPPMFAQPFIENAIEHGIAKMQDKGKINVSFSLKGEQIKLEIKDNGIGIAASTQMKIQENKKHQSLASIITQERIQAFRKSINKKITFQIESQNNGTTVIFYLPYQLA